MGNTVAFSGYRTEKLPENIDQIRINLKNVVAECIEDGYNTFLCGMADGFDLMSAEIVLEFKKSTDIKLICVIPFDDGREKSALYSSILEQSDDKIVLSDKFSYNSYYVRNEYMVDNCDKMNDILKNLDPQDKSYLNKYLKKGQTSVYMDMTNPVHIKLKSYGVIQLPLGTNLGILTTFSGFISPLAVEILNKHPEYLK